MITANIGDRQLESTRNATYILSPIFISGKLARAKKVKTKICNCCKEVKELTEFSKQSRAKDGLKSYCKSCASKKNKATYWRNRGAKVPYVRESLNHDIPVGMKYCPTCEKILSQDEFGVNNSTLTGLHGQCIKCAAKRTSKYHRSRKENTPAIYRHTANMAWLKHTYGITEEQFQDMMNDQKGCCKICLMDFGDLPKRAFVDHDHSTGKIRGLLCKDCNTLLGKVEAKQHLLNNINLYLNKEY